MQWSDSAIVLSARRLGENSGVIHILTPEHGMYAGVDRAAFSSRRRGVYQPGNIVAAYWNARLPEHLGTLACELAHAVTAHLLDDRRKLAALISATCMAQKMLAEREAQPEAFARMHSLIHALTEGGDWRAEYVRLEFALLACTGFGLDLERCAATGQEHDLLYVSPKSGRAVSRAAGEPYREKLLRLPSFLLAAQEMFHVEHAQILDGLRLCGYFLEARVFAPRGLGLPAMRARFIQALKPEEYPIGEIAQQVG